jgi:hypothetical protein
MQLGVSFPGIDPVAGVFVSPEITRRRKTSWRQSTRASERSVKIAVVGGVNGNLGIALA